MTDNKKTLMLALAGGAAIIAGALIYNYIFQDHDGESDDEEVPTADIPDDEELTRMLKEKNLTDVKKDGVFINTQYFLTLLQFVGETTRQVTDGARKNLTDQRRKVLLKINEKEKETKQKVDDSEYEPYKALVEKAIRLEDGVAQQLVLKIFDLTGISEQEFGMRHQQLASNPQTAELVMAAQQGKLKQPDMKKAPTLTKEQTLMQLAITSKIQEEQMQLMKKNADAHFDFQGDQMSAMITMMTEQLKAQDQIFFETKVEADEFEASLMHYCTTDVQVQAKMREYMSKMQKMQGGM